MERKIEISKDVRQRFMKVDQRQRRSTQELQEMAYAIEYFYKIYRWQLDKTVSMKKKKRRESSQTEGCGICYETMGKEMAILPCTHCFCLSCLNRWLNTSTSCPFCRSNCTYMTINGDRLDIQPIEKMETEDDDFDPCYMCGSAEDEANLLICDFCDARICHVYCDRALRGRMPATDEMWYCHHCRGEETYEVSSDGYRLDGFVVPDE